MAERFLPIFRAREIPDEVRSSGVIDRISTLYWRLAHNPRVFRDGPSWEEISPADLEILTQEEREYLGNAQGNRPWVYSHARGNEAFIAFGLGENRVKFFVNGGKPQMIQERRISVGVWEKVAGREASWERIGNVLTFIEGVPQRRLLDGASSPQINGLPGPKV